jgi:hypothetical protein
MPVNPRGSLGKSKQQTTEKVKNSFLIYSFFVILLLEIASIVINNNVSEDNYLNLYYPIITNLDFAILFGTFYLFRKRLKFCFRKKIAIASLVLYYSFNALSVIFKLEANSYYSLVSYGLLGVVFATLVLTFFFTRNES